jgi:signal transduction histidine kinase/ligand-binding sensor domain-containing protein/DNA-binding response OmpR family regulator
MQLSSINQILFYFVLSTWFLSGIVSAQNIRTGTHFDQLTVRDGISQSSVLAIWQDRYGFMWLGTRNGLNCYDGYRFTVFQQQHDDSSSLSSNHVNSISEDSRGNLWIATEGGLSVYQRDSRAFKNYRIDDKSPAIRQVMVDSQDRIWTASRWGVHWFDAKQKVFKPVQTDIVGAADQLDHSSTSLLEARDGTIWIGSAHLGLLGLKEKTQTLIHIDSLEHKLRLSDLRIEALAEDSSSYLWVGTKEGGAFRISQQGKWQRFYPEHPQEDFRLAHRNARALSVDHAGHVWIGTFDGLNRYDPQAHKLLTYQHHEGNLHSLSHASVRALFTDQKGSTWIGTYFGGVNIYDKDNQRFSHSHHVPGDRYSLSFDVVGAFCETGDGKLIVGTERGGINVVDPRKGIHLHHLHRPDDVRSLSGNTIKSLLTDSRERVWVGTFRQGLNLFDPQNGQVQRYPLAADPAYTDMRHRVVNCIVEDGSGMLWLGLDGKGSLRKFDPQQEHFVAFRYRDSLYRQLGDVSLKHILIDRLGNLWLATRENGLYLFNEGQGLLAHFHSKDSLHYLPQQEIAHVFEDRQGNIWLSSLGGGIFSFDPLSKSFRSFTRQDGLADNVVYGMQQDDEGRLWCFTLSGLSRFNPQEKSFKNYTYRSGFPLEELNENAFYTSQQGEMLAGGSNGYVGFDPLTLSENTFVPPVCLLRLQVGEKEVRPGDESGILSRPLQQTEEIVLDYFHNTVRIEFAALSYLRPENNRYAYQLKGFDTQWYQAHSERSATYTNLAEGTYIFKVKGSNNDGLWNENPTLLRIRVLPPPWKTWWAYLIYALLIGGGFLLIRASAIKEADLRHQIRLEELEKRKWKEVHQLKMAYFTEVSHEFRTPLTLIAGPLEKLLDSREGSQPMRRQLKMMYYNCRRLLLLIDQILELRRIESRHARLELLPVSLQAVLQEVTESFKSMADQLNIKLLYHHEEDERLFMLDRDKLEKICFNLLYNAFKFTDSGGEIEVRLTYLDEEAQSMALISFRDSGQGIAEKDQQRIFERFYSGKSDKPGSGIGLAMVKSLLDLMGGEIGLKSRQGEGSSFRVRLPLQEASEVSPSEISKDQRGFIKPLPLEYEAEFRNKTGEVSSPSHAPKHKACILLADDHAEVRYYLREHLEDKYEVILAKNGQKALSKIKKHHPDLIISDVMMPELDGIGLLKKVRSNAKISHIPVILLTARSDDDERLSGLEEGADAYLAKPFLLKELDHHIRNILRHREQMRQKFGQHLQLPSDTGLLSSHDDKLLKKIYRFVEENMNDPKLNVEYLGQEVGLSRVHLYRKMKALTGMAPADYIRSFRLKQAAILLSSGKYKVAEVAYHVGYQDVNYFSKSFRKEHRRSPTEWMSGQESDEAESPLVS